MIFTLADLKRLAPGGSGTLADRHQALFSTPRGGSFYDRESAFLTSKGYPRSEGTLSDRWRKYLGVPGNARISAYIRPLASFPAASIKQSGKTELGAMPQASAFKTPG